MTNRTKLLLGATAGVLLLCAWAAGNIYYETLPGLVVKHPVTGVTTLTINGTNGNVNSSGTINGWTVDGSGNPSTAGTVIVNNVTFTNLLSQPGNSNTNLGPLNIGMNIASSDPMIGFSYNTLPNWALSNPNEPGIGLFIEPNFWDKSGNPFQEFYLQCSRTNGSLTNYTRPLFIQVDRVTGLPVTTYLNGGVWLELGLNAGTGGGTLPTVGYPYIILSSADGGIFITNVVSGINQAYNLKSVAGVTSMRLGSSDTTNPFRLVFVRSAGGSGAYWSIQSIEENVGYRDIILQPTAGNLGVGKMLSPTSTLHVAGSFAKSIAVGSAFTLTDTNEVYLCNVDGQTVTLPTAVGHRGRNYSVKTITPAATCTIATTSSQLIDGASTYSLSASNKFIRVISDGTNWWNIGSN